MALTIWEPRNHSWDPKPSQDLWDYFRTDLQHSTDHHADQQILTGFYVGFSGSFEEYAKIIGMKKENEAVVVY